jgi:hypothetical protein
LKDKGDTLVVRSPEKAGVGGSTPSLATIFSITYKRSKVQSCHTLSHKIQSCSEFASNILHSDRVDKIRNCNQCRSRPCDKNRSYARILPR